MVVIGYVLNIWCIVQKEFQMKRNFVLFIALFMSAGLCGNAFATDFEVRGSAIVPNMGAVYSTSAALVRSYIFVTNVSGGDVDCRITFYDHAGNDVTSYCSVYSGNTSGKDPVTIASGSGTFELPAGESRYARLSVSDTSKYIQGYAVVEWASSNTTIRKALIAFAKSYGVNGDRGTELGIQVNGGQPF